MTTNEAKLVDVLNELIAAWDEIATNPNAEKLYDEDLWERARQLVRETS